MIDRGQRAALFGPFLAKAGWRDAEWRVLSADASFRHYYRVTQGTRRAVLMDAPPPQEDVRPFVGVARRLARLGLSAPSILASDMAAGLLLIEDFGDDTYSRLLRREDAPDETALYTLAVDALVFLHRQWTAESGNDACGADGDAYDVPAYDDDRLDTEAALLVDWYAREVGAPCDASDRADYLALWRPLYAQARAVPQSLVLRDYHVDNLMLLPDRAGVAACGLLDFQDAVLGPVTYDLVSLLEDARRDVDPGLAARLKQRYLAACPEIDRAAFEASYAILGAQRNAKIVGIFTRLWRRDGKPDYLRHIPRVWRLLEGDLRHPALAGVRDWFDTRLPASLRVLPHSGDAA